MKKRIFTLCVFILAIVFCYSQPLKHKSKEKFISENNNFFYNKVLKNILIYNILQSYKNDSSLEHSYTLYTDRFFECNHLPDSGNDYILSFSPYENMNLLYPNKIWVKFFFSSDAVINDGVHENLVLITELCNLFPPESRKGIVVFDTSSRLLRYVSGYFFKDQISQFLLSLSTDTADFVKVRYFNFDPENVKCENNECTFFSPVTNKKYKILFVRRENILEDILIEVDD